MKKNKFTNYFIKIFGSFLLIGFVFGIIFLNTTKIYALGTFSAGSLPVSDITANSARLHGAFFTDVSPNSGAYVKNSFLYGTNSSPSIVINGSNITSWTASSSNQTSLILSGLEPNTTYYYKFNPLINLFVTGTGWTHFNPSPAASALSFKTAKSQMEIVGSPLDPIQHQQVDSTCSVSANPSSVISGGSSVVSWSSQNADSCNSGGHGNGISGSFNVSPATTTSYPISCTKNSETISGLCSGNYNAIVGACEGTVVGSTHVGETGPYEGMACNEVFDTYEQCTQGWIAHGCHWNNNATESVSCLPFNTPNLCNAHSTCVWTPGYTIPAVTGSCSATVTVSSLPSGTINVPDCVIQNGASNCSSSYSLTITNPIVPNLVIVKKLYNNNTMTVYSQASSGNVSFSNNYYLNHGTQTFSLWHNNVMLASDNAIAECANGTSWNGVICTNLSPSGTVTTHDCDIAEGSSSCGSSVDWTTSNLTSGVTEITKNNPPNTLVVNNATIVNSPSGTKNTTLNYGANGFFLYHNINGTPTILATSVGTASCGAGLVWNDSKCVKPDCENCNTVGQITAGDCSIAINSSTCLAHIVWSTSNLTSGVTEITKNNPPNTLVVNNATIVNSPSGTKNTTLNYGANGFFLYHNINGTPTILATSVGTATCVNGGFWNGTKCALAVYGCLDPNATNYNSNANMPDNNSCTYNTPYPDHCINRVLDSEKGETGVDCGGECPKCGVIPHYKEN